MFRFGLAPAALLSLISLFNPGPVQAADSPAAPKVASQAFSSWLYRCQEVAAPAKTNQACEIVQEMVVQKDDKSIPVLTMAFARAEAGAKSHVVTILAPLGVQLKPGLQISADDGKPVTFDFQYCDQRGCWIAGEKGDALLAMLKQGKTGAAKMTLVNGRNLTINFSLAGLGMGVAALDSGKTPIQTAQASTTPPPANPEKPKTN